MLEALDLTRKLPKEEARARVGDLQSRLHQLQRLCFHAELPTIVVFEGWSFAGRGKVIRKLTERLEPRAFQLHYLAGPRSYERQLPWMRRYWTRIPAYGHMAIFHRSWHQRVVHLRTNGELDEAGWLRRYEDIRAFERTLAEDRYVLVKFFLHISREELARRIEEIAADPLRAWMVQDVDREMLERYHEVERIWEETLAKTETEWGPWSLVAATDRHWARVRTFEILVRTLEDALEKRGLGRPEYEPKEVLDRADDEDLDG